MTAIRVVGLGKSYRTYESELHRFLGWFGLPAKPPSNNWVLRNINFSVAAGEALGILGVNGAGKSTLLKIIAGTLSPTEGEVSLNGRVSAILELGMGFNPDISGRENARHSAGLMGFSKVEIESMLAEIEAFADIGEYFDKPIRTYSSGMQMRVAFAVATAWRPEVLIVDEALAVGDAFFSAKCFQRISKYRSEGTTLLFVTHNPSEMVKHCDRAILLENGALTAIGEPKQITNRYLDAAFGKPDPVEDEGDGFYHSDALVVVESSDKYHTRPGYNAEEHRWGHGGAHIIDFLITNQGLEYPASSSSGTQLDIYFKVLFDEGYESIVPGLLIKTLEGIFVYGTNSLTSTFGRSQVCAGKSEVLVFKFSLPLLLNKGEYLLSLGISSGFQTEALTGLDRRYDSIIFGVENTVPVTGLVDFKAEFETVESNRSGLF
ncbi:ABC transporter ATP-binding protein [Luminiphilus sp.]|nr:ABC transporter ATP-binding protein [Luminiphilus sp.]